MIVYATTVPRVIEDILVLRHIIRLINEFITIARDWTLNSSLIQ